MTKLTLAFTLLTSLALAGTALADGNHGRGPAPIVDRRVQVLPTPAFQHRPTVMQSRWSLVSAQRAGARRGTMTIDLPRMAKYDQLRLIASDRGLDIKAIEISYGRGRTQIVQPDSDGMITLDLGRGNVRSIAVRYVNRGAGRDASIKLLAKDNDAGRGGNYGRDRRM